MTSRSYKVLLALVVAWALVFQIGAVTLINLATQVVGVLAVANGGTGTASTLTGLMRGSATAMTAAELSGDVTTSGSNSVTLAHLHNIALSTQTAPACTSGGGTTTFIGPAGSSTSEVTVSKWTATEAFTISKMYVLEGAATPASESAAYTMMLATSIAGGSAQTVTATVAAAASTANDTAHSFTVAAGNQVYAKVVCSGGTTALTPQISIGVGYK